MAERLSRAEVLALVEEQASPLQVVQALTGRGIHPIFVSFEEARGWVCIGGVPSAPQTRADNEHQKTYVASTVQVGDRVMVESGQPLFVVYNRREGEVFARVYSFIAIPDAAITEE